MLKLPATSHLKVLEKRNDISRNSHAFFLLAEKKDNVKFLNRYGMKNNYPHHLDTVKVCKKDLCIEAKGSNADAIVSAVSVMLLLIGIGALIKAVN